MKHCPHCNGLVQNGATKCKHCKNFIEKEIVRNIIETPNKTIGNPDRVPIIPKQERVVQDNTIQRDNKIFNIWFPIGIITISFVVFSYYLMIKIGEIEKKTNYNTGGQASFVSETTSNTVQSKQERAGVEISQKIEETKMDTSQIDTSKTERKITKVLQDVNLREDSTASSEKIHTIYEGDEVEILEKMTNSQGYIWYRVNHKGIEGWISYIGFETKKEEKIIPFKTLSLVNISEWEENRELRKILYIGQNSLKVSIFTKEDKSYSTVDIYYQGKHITGMLPEWFPVVDIGPLEDTNQDGIYDIRILGYGGVFIIIQFDEKNIIDITNGIFFESEIYEKGNFYYTIQQKNKTSVTDCDFKKVTKYTFKNGKLVELETKETNVKYRFVQEPVPDEINGGVMCYALGISDYGKEKIVKNAGF